MSLLTEALETVTIINKIAESDGYGGIEITYTDGAKIKAALTFDSSNEAKIAEAMGATSTYTVTVRKDIELDYHTILRRESDGAIFRLTSNSDDRKTPESAALNMRQYSAERWKLDE